MRHMRFLVAVALMLVAADSGRAQDQTPPPTSRPPVRAEAPPLPQIVLPRPVPLYSEPRIMPPWPALPDSWEETPKEECELLPDREEARLCVQYPQRESILNSAILGRPAHSIVGVRWHKVLKSCPIIPSGEARAIVCGKLAEQYELYCCD
jgi:hypothetical protein